MATLPLLPKPPALTSNDITGAVFPESLPALTVSLPSSSSLSMSSSTSDSNQNALTGPSAVIVAFGLSLIPTLAVSIPFFLRQGRLLETTNNSESFQGRYENNHMKVKETRIKLSSSLGLGLPLGTT